MTLKLVLSSDLVVDEVRVIHREIRGLVIDVVPTITT